MPDKTSTGLTIYQGSGINSVKIFVRGLVHLYGIGQGQRFNPTKPKFRGKCEALGSDVYLIVDAQQADKYTKIMESILNYIQCNFNKGNYVKQALEELKIFNSNIVKPKTPDSIPLKVSVGKIILR